MFAFRSIAGLVAGGALLCGCASSRTPSAGQQSGSILVSSDPSAGATVGSPVEELQLDFKPRARLDEVTVSGPDGIMPSMIHAAGEISHYSIPLPDLGPGAYTVNWRATAQRREYRGSFGFKVNQP